MNTKRLKEAKNVFIKRSFVLGIVAILVCWFMKMVGFDIFGLDLNNKFFNDMDLFLQKYHLKDLFSLIILNIQLYLMVGIVNKQQGKELWLFILKCLPLTILVRLFTTNISGNLSMVLEFIFLVIVTSKFNYRYFIKSFLLIFITMIYQLISLNTRSLYIKAHTYGYVASMILTIDYTLLLYLHKEMEVASMGDTSWLFFGTRKFLYTIAGFIVGLFVLHPIKKAKEWRAKGEKIENDKKARKETARAK